MPVSRANLDFHSTKEVCNTEKEQTQKQKKVEMMSKPCNISRWQKLPIYAQNEVNFFTTSAKCSPSEMPNLILLPNKF